MSPSAGVVWAVAAFAGAIAVAAAVCLLPVWTVGLAGLAAGAAVTTLLLVDAAYLGPYARELPPLALAAATAAALGSLAASRASTTTQWGWRTALFLAVAVSALKLAVFLHPDAPIGDAMFHVHRARAVRAGQYLFTSVTPRPFYEFPYPIGLYVVAQSLWEMFPDRVMLLRGVTLIADAVVALALFAVAAARWGVATGVVAAALALAVPVVTQSVSTANLTNVFAQSCFSLAVAWIGWSLSSKFPGVSAIVTVAVLTSSYLSHFSTAVIGIPAAILIAIVIAGARDPSESRQWRWIASAVAVSMVVSYAVYYSHFHDVYLRTWSRVGQEGASTSLVATLGEHSESKSMTVGRFLLSNYGWAALLLTIVGIATSIRRGWRDAWNLTLLAFAIVVVAFLVLGAVTPIEMRANLAAHPLVALFAALGCTSLWASDRAAARAACVVAVGMTVWAGIAALVAVLTG